MTTEDNITKEATSAAVSTKRFYIDDEVLKSSDVGIEYVDVGPVYITISCTKLHGKEIQIPISKNWEQVSKTIEDKASAEFGQVLNEDNDGIGRLQRFIGNSVYLENADLIASLVITLEEKSSKKKESENDNKKAKDALKLAERYSKELFLDQFGRAYAAILVNDRDGEQHTENLLMSDDRFKTWISARYYDEYDRMLSDEDLKKISRILKARAQFDSSILRYKLDLRVRGYNNKVLAPEANATDSSIFDEDYEDTENFTEIYYDLTNSKWEAIKITADGWQVVRDPPILFKRYGSEKPQVYPSKEYSSDIMDKFISLQNIKDDAHKLLKKVWLVAGFWPNTTHKAILIVNASQGSAKTTMSDMDRDLVDPNVAKTSSLPKLEFNLKQYLAHNHMSSFDNVSYINDEQSDILCRAVTGGRDTKRKLFEDDEDIIYDYRRIIALNGIVNAATRGDLLNRSFIIELESIPQEQRELLTRITRQFKGIKPQLLAFCLDTISEVLAERQKWQDVDPDYYGLKDVIDKTGGLPRLANYAMLGEQIAAVMARKEGKPYEPGDFLRVWNQNNENLNTEALKSSLVAQALISFMMDNTVRLSKPVWEGSATMLLSDLNTFILAHDDVKIDAKSKTWPKDPSVLGRELARIKTNLEPLGIKVQQKRITSNMMYTITYIPAVAAAPSSSDKKTAIAAAAQKEPRKPTDEPTHPTYPTYDENSCSDIGESYVGNDVGYVGQPTLYTPYPTYQNTLNPAQHVGNVGYVRQSTISEGLLYCIMRVCMNGYSRDIPVIDSNNGNNKTDYFLGSKFKQQLMSQPAVQMTEDEAEQTFQAMIESGEVVETGEDMYQPTSYEKIMQYMNWGNIRS